MKNVKIPFSSYQKKKEYNFPKMNISNLELEEFHVKWLKDQESNLVFEKKNVGLVTKNIIPIIYDKNLNLINLNK